MQNANRSERSAAKAHVPKIIYGTAWTQAVAACLDQKLTRTDLYLQTKFTAVSGQGRNLVVPLTGTRSETYMRENLGIFDFELTDLEHRAVDALL
jgi:aryl-alcohol dehydrogenase-like predicted oxidoreductase